MALYKEIMVNNYQGLEKYFEMIRFANLDHPTDVEVDIIVRDTFGDKYRRFYW